jgi:NADH:ubiquinone oxidoreductase subunit 6 (subunit J)
LLLLGLEIVALILIIILVGALVVYYLRIIRVINPGREIFYLVEKVSLTRYVNGVFFGIISISFIYVIKTIFIQAHLLPLTNILNDRAYNMYSRRLWRNREMVFGTYRTTRFCIYILLITILISLKWLFRKE